MTIILLMVASCDKKENPVLGDNELGIFLKQTGVDLVKYPYQEMDVFIGDTLYLDLMLSANGNVKTVWTMKDSEEVLSENSKINYIPTAKENFSLIFTAENENGVKRQVEFKIQSFYKDELYSKPGMWKYKSIYSADLTGKFSITFDVLNWGKGMNANIGLCEGNISNISELPIDIHFEERYGRGVIECNNGNIYTFDHEVKWGYGQVLHLKLDVDITNLAYTLTDTETGIVIAENYKFKTPNIKLDNWAIFSAADLQYSTLSVYNMALNVLEQDNSPRFEPLESVSMFGGEIKRIEVKVVDPMGLSNKITASDLPRFCRFTDNGNNTAILDLNPYQDNDVDAGDYTIRLKAVNANGLSSETDLNVEVKRYYLERTVEVRPTANDGVVYDNGTVNKVESTIIYNTTNTWAVVMNFKLPIFDDIDKIDFIGAELNVKLNRKDAVNYNCDLYAIKCRDTDAIIASDYYRGDYLEINDDGSVVGIMDNFMTKDSQLGDIKTSEDAGEKLIDFIKSQYEEGGAGKYMFLRFNMDSESPAAWQRYTINKGEDGANSPVLTIRYKYK